MFVKKKMDDITEILDFNHIEYGNFKDGIYISFDRRIKVSVWALLHQIVEEQGLRVLSDPTAKQLMIYKNI